MKPTPERALPVYTMDEPACTPADRVVVAVTAPLLEAGKLEALLRCLLPTAPVLTPPPRPMPTNMECRPDAKAATSDWDHGSGNPVAALASGNAGSSLGP